MRTITNIAFLDLTQDFGPDGCMAGFVGVDSGGFEVDDLGNAAGWHFFLFVDLSVYSFSILSFWSGFIDGKKKKKKGLGHVVCYVMSRVVTVGVYCLILFIKR